MCTAGTHVIKLLFGFSPVNLSLIPEKFLPRTWKGRVWKILLPPPKNISSGKLLGKIKVQSMVLGDNSRSRIGLKNWIFVAV